ncbi:hypothetical protein C8R45DRAFT_1116997 [Mycena sanguinolenta]|nr:hypothetical protein C8R45DRAFT_1116997 [Mycena sanguinolenta]
MSSESPVAKRQRTEDSASITRSPDLWIPDGNVVLQLGNTQFRVHWSVLARHSSVFRYMQGLPQPSGEPNVDGCPVVQLPDDLTDVEYLLNALYDPIFLGQKTLPLPAIGAFIRLGRKYDFSHFLELAVSRLTDEFPTTLTKYDAPAPYDTIEWYEGIELDMVTLLSENDILSALPAACCVHDQVQRSGDLLDGIDKVDGTRASLSQTDLRRCAVGQLKLSSKQFEPVVRLGGPGNGSLKIVLLQCVGREKIWEELPEIFDLPAWNELENDL